MDAWRCGTCRVRMRTTRRKTLVNARSRRVRTDGRTVRYERQSRRVDGRFDAWLGVSWRAASLRTGLDLERLYDRPSGHAWTACSLTFYVLSYACAHGRCHTAVPRTAGQASTPPGRNFFLGVVEQLYRMRF